MNQPALLWYFPGGHWLQHPQASRALAPRTLALAVWAALYPQLFV